MKGVTKRRKSKKNRQHNDQKKKNKRTNNCLQNIRQKTKDLATRTLTHLILGRQKQNKWLKQD